MLCYFILFPKLHSSIAVERRKYVYILLLGYWLVQTHEIVHQKSMWLVIVLLAKIWDC
jgi:hypothetical protein